MEILFLIIGVYLLIYQTHCEEVNRYMNKCEEEAIKENTRRNEKRIRTLHSKGIVFNKQEKLK